MSAAAPVLDTDTVPRLRAVIGRLHRHLRSTPAAAAAGLTPTRLSILFTLTRSGPIRLSDLAAEEGVNPTMLSRVIGDLAEAGLVKRVSDPDDRRAALVKATADGRRLVDRVRRERADVLSAALSELAPADRQSLEDALPVLEDVASQLKGRRR